MATEEEQQEFLALPPPCANEADIEEGLELVTSLLVEDPSLIESRDPEFDMPVDQLQQFKLEAVHQNQPPGSCSNKKGLFIIGGVITILLLAAAFLFGVLSSQYSSIEIQNSKLYDDEIQEDDNMQGIVVASKTWSSNQILYTYAGDNNNYGFTETEKMIIRREMDTIMTTLDPGCIEFEERDEVDRYTRHMELHKTEGNCEAHVGRKDEGKTEIRLGTECFLKNGTILHELMHIIGVYHEMNRPDRDLFLDINLSQIQEEHKMNFIKKDRSTYDLAATMTPFDVFSIMNYQETEGCKKDKVCMKVKEKFRKKFERNGIHPLKRPITELSATDIVDVSKRYSCDIQPDIQKEYVKYALDMIETILDYADDEECFKSVDSVECRSLKFEAHVYMLDLEGEWRRDYDSQMKDKYCNFFNKRLTEHDRKDFYKENLNSWFQKYGKDI